MTVILHACKKFPKSWGETPRVEDNGHFLMQRLLDLRHQVVDGLPREPQHPPTGQRE